MKKVLAFSVILLISSSFLKAQTNVCYFYSTAVSTDLKELYITNLYEDVSPNMRRGNKWLAKIHGMLGKKMMKFSELTTPSNCDSDKKGIEDARKKTIAKFEGRGYIIHYINDYNPANEKEPQ
ncbi:MAG: hypothetical protein NTX03_01615 [Bacteroidetes bacterium]|nr:hypothetical protein [Bacteroidota bacterium]